YCDWSFSYKTIKFYRGYINTPKTESTWRGGLRIEDCREGWVIEHRAWGKRVGSGQLAAGRKNEGLRTPSAGSGQVGTRQIAHFGLRIADWGFEIDEVSVFR
ncbi:MAG: hypothetical protein PVH39_11220, partial [Syntrophobacterales bacterium]